MSLIALGWLFGATLILGTAGPSKLRWGLELNVWQGAALLGLAAACVLACGAALRCFAHQNRRGGWALSAVFVLAFTPWSAIVRYSVIVAFVVLATGAAALVFASTRPSPSEGSTDATTSTSSGPPRAERWLWNVAAMALPLLSGPLFYGWLTVSPKPWVDPECGWPDWLPLTFIPFLAVPGLMAWIRPRTIGRVAKRPQPR